MDLLQSLPAVQQGGKEEQARDIYERLTEARAKGDHGIWYRPCGGVVIDPTVQRALELKGYTVFDQSKYDLKWTREGPVRGAVKHIRYWIGVPCCNCCN